MEQLLNDQPKLRKEVASIDSLSVLLASGLNNPESVKLSPDQRAAIFQSGRAPKATDVESTYKKNWVRPFVVTLGAAATVALGFVWLNNMSGHNINNQQVGTKPKFEDIEAGDLAKPVVANDKDWEGGENTTGGASAVSSQGDGVKTVEEGLENHPLEMREHIGKHVGKAPEVTENKVALTENNWVSTETRSVLRMPMVCGNASWQWVANAVNENGIHPEKNAVRVEEILNAFSYELPNDTQVGDINAGVEIVACPWNSRNLLAVVLLRNPSEATPSVEAAVEMSQLVKRHRLIGFGKAQQEGDAKKAPEAVRMQPGYGHLVMYELEVESSAQAGDELLKLHVRSEGNEVNQEALKKFYNSRHWTKANQDTQFSLILATWAQVLADSKFDSDMGMDGILSMVAYFEKAHTMSDEQKKALEVIKSSCEMAQK